MKAKVTLEVEVYDVDLVRTLGEEEEPITENRLEQYIADELGWAFASFSNVDLKSIQVTDKKVTQ